METLTTEQWLEQIHFELFFLVLVAIVAVLALIMYLGVKRRFMKDLKEMWGDSAASSFEEFVKTIKLGELYDRPRRKRSGLRKNKEVGGQS